MSDLIGPNREDILSALEQCIADAKYLSAVRDAVAELEINISKDPAYSAAILTYMVDHRRPRGLILKFLKDRTLNAPGQGNYGRAFKYLAEAPLRSVQRPRTLRIVEDALRVGLLDDEEILDILGSIRSFRVNEGTLASMEPEVVHGYYEVIWCAIKSCKVFGPKDLDPTTLRKWINLVTGMPWSARGYSLYKEIVSQISSVDFWDMVWMTSSLAEWVQALARHGCNETDLIELSKLTTFLNNLPDKIAPEVVLRTTERLVMLAKTDDSLPILKIWGVVISNLSNADSILKWPYWTKLKPLSEAPESTASMGVELTETIQSPSLVEAGRPDDTAQGPSDSRLSPLHRTLILLWTARTLDSSVTPTLETDTAHRKLFETLTRHITDYCSLKSEDVRAALLFAAYELRLPPNGLLEVIAPHLDRRLSTRLTHFMDEVLDRPELLDDALIDDRLYVTARNHALPVLNLMASALDLHSDSTANLLLSAVQTDVHSHPVIFRSLRRNSGVKLNLAKTWDYARRLATAPASNSATASAELSETPLVTTNATVVDPDADVCVQTLEFLHNLAVAFACSPVLSPTRAFFKARQVYKFVFGHSGPIMPKMTRALYYAGVTRYRQEGKPFPAGRYEWIMDRVRAVEGNEVANRLEGGY